MKHIRIMLFVFGLWTISFASVYATPFTPIEWQQKVEKHPNDSFINQRKHTTWVRDRDRNFIDDVIDRQMGKVKQFDVIIDLNSFLKTNEIKKIFNNYGRIKYVGKMITSLFLNNVKADDLSKIAKMPEVAMIEIQKDFEPAIDTSARAVQSKASQTLGQTYYSMAVADVGLTGSGINIAVIDTGVDDDHEQLISKRMAGFNATVFEDTNSNGIDDSCEPAPLGNGVCTDPDDEPGDGTTNPDDDWCSSNHGHGTLVAGIAVGKGVAGTNCRTPPNELESCAGVAPGANLIDIKVCYKEDNTKLCKTSCEELDMTEALDWLGLNYEKYDVRVANMSLTYRSDNDEDGNNINDDGTSLIPQQVNYLSALGIVMVAAHGNLANLPWHYTQGSQVTQSPGSASFAVTVSGTNDNDTITRSDDGNLTGYLVGPRMDFDPLSPNLLALKPDISAPAQNIMTAIYNSTNAYAQEIGTSLAAPHVSGAAAILLEAKQKMNPGDVKDALIQSADKTHNTSAYSSWNWDNAFGWGMLNVRAAVDSTAATDVGFPTCGGPPSSPGRPCALNQGLPFWNNNLDIDTLAPPQAGVGNTITADVQNFGSVEAKVLVNFGVYIFAAGNNQFFHIGTKQETIAPNSVITVPHPWTPASSDHQCVQVSIDYGLDTNFDNNITQRNLSVSPSVYTVRVENPFAVPAAFRVDPKSLRDGWDCRVKEASFKLHPYRDPPKIVQINFEPPEDAKAGERADCNIAVFAMPEGKKKEILIGGVTVRTFEPKPCRMIGWIRDKTGKSIQGAEVIIGPERQPIKALSDKYGIVSLEGIPYRPQLITVITKKYGKQSAKDRLYCGPGTFEILVNEKGLAIETHQRSKDWAWDPQLRESDKLKRISK
jgi:subtilisin family serine protease